MARRRRKTADTQVHMQHHQVSRWAACGLTDPQQTTTNPSAVACSRCKRTKAFKAALATKDN